MENPVGRGPLLTNRRAAISSMSGVFISLGMSVDLAKADEETKSELFVDDKFGVKFEVPKGWSKSDTELPSPPGEGPPRRIVIFVDPKDKDTNAFINYTPVRGDYTALGSFGNAEYVGRSLVPNIPGVDENKLLSADSLNGFYYFDYQVREKPDDPLRIFRTVFALVPGEMLITLTTQTTNSRLESEKDMKDELANIVKSFTLKR